jgi:hypothetical protein
MFARDQSSMSSMGGCSWGKVDCVEQGDVRWPAHPHAIPSQIVAKALARRSKARPNNSIYTPRDALSFEPRLPGFGTFKVFRAHQEKNPLRLTSADRGINPNGNRSTWELPDFFHRKLSHIGEARWEEKENSRKNRCTVSVKGQGQEYVYELSKNPCERAKIRKWLQSLWN